MIKRLILKLLFIYRRFLSFDLGILKTLAISPSVCRFTPSCSEYAYKAIEKYGILKGTWKAAGRISRCHTLHPGGYDPV